MQSPKTAAEYVIGKVESTGSASRADFDIDAIVEACHALTEDWDIGAVDQQTFWLVTAAHMRL